MIIFSPFYIYFFKYEVIYLCEDFNLNRDADHQYNKKRIDHVV
jgi:hypothetical protein